MSATNWAVCPHCLRRMKAARKNALEEAERSYGKVPAEVFIANRADALAMPDRIDNENDYSLREDYNGIGVGLDGIFTIHYRAACTRCNFDFTYEVDMAAYESWLRLHPKEEIWQPLPSNTGSAETG